jgi:hypothetical protein
MANTKITSRVIADNSVGIDALNVTDGTNGQALVTDGSGGLSFASVGVSGIDSSADATAITIDSSENVGIGSIDPLSKLDVAGNIRISDGSLEFDKPSVYGFRFLHNDAGNDLSIQQGDANNANYVTRLNINSSGNVTFAQNISSVNNLYVADDIGHAGDSDTYMSFENDYLGFYTGGANTLVLSGGQVGVGGSPAAKFSVDVGAPGSTDQTLGLFQSQDGRRIGFVWDDSTSTLGVATLTNHALTFHTNGNSSERMRLTSDGVAMGDTDGDYTHRGATGGLHVKRGGILMNGPPGDANMSSAAADNCWTYHGQGGRGGNFTSLTISVPNPNNGASGVGYGGFSLEFYIAGYNAKFFSGHFSGYVNNSITLSKRAFWDSSGSGTLSSGSVGSQGFYLTIGFPSMTHPTCKFVINKGGHGASGPYTDMDGVSITWA